MPRNNSGMLILYVQIFLFDAGVEIADPFIYVFRDPKRIHWMGTNTCFTSTFRDSLRHQERLGTKDTEMKTILQVDPSGHSFPLKYRLIIGI